PEGVLRQSKAHTASFYLFSKISAYGLAFPSPQKASGLCGVPESRKTFGGKEQPSDKFKFDKNLNQSESCDLASGEVCL
ncbi:MAG: hypothetical protein IJM94_00490, partial [Clostridia bacterium]|nr:hypothetical protein [Clostridia bacterium]